MKALTRITLDPEVMGGKPCIRGLRVTVGMVVGLVASGYSSEEILELYPYLEGPDIREALAYAAWRAAEVEVPLAGPRSRTVAAQEVSFNDDSLIVVLSDGRRIAVPLAWFPRLLHASAAQ